MTIGEVRSKLELNYEKHYENVKTNYYISNKKAIQYIQEQTGCEYDIAEKIVQDWMNKSNIEYRNSNEIIVECPYCHSQNTSKISNLSKAGHFALFGIFSLSRNSKQWHCNQCGSDF